MIPTLNIQPCQQRLRLWRLADDHLHHMTVGIIIIPLEKSDFSYDLPASDARLTQSGVKGVYLPWYVFYLPCKQTAHKQSSAFLIVRWTDTLADIISQMVWIF